MVDLNKEYLIIKGKSGDRKTAHIIKIIDFNPNTKIVKFKCFTDRDCNYNNVIYYEELSNINKYFIGYVNKKIIKLLEALYG